MMLDTSTCSGRGIDLLFERVHQRLDRRDMRLDACLDRKRLRRLDCVDHVSVMDREINRLGPLGKVFVPAQTRTLRTREVAFSAANL